MSVPARALGLQEGYSQEQWGPWCSFGLLVQQAVAELGWQESFVVQSRSLAVSLLQSRPVSAVAQALWLNVRANVAVEVTVPREARWLRSENVQVEVLADGSLQHRPKRPDEKKATSEAQKKAWRGLQDRVPDRPDEDLPLTPREDTWEASPPARFEWDFPEKWTSAIAPAELEGWGKEPQDELEERQSAQRLVRNVDTSTLATLVRIGEGVGPITYSRSPGVHQSLNRELRQRLVAQDAAALFLLLFILGVAIWVSCLGVYQFADDPSQVAFYTDPRHTQQHTHQRMLCVSADQESFLEAFNTQPQRATLRLIGRRSARRQPWLGARLGRLMPGRRRPVADANLIFDVSLDLSTFISGQGHLSSAAEASKLASHLGSPNPLEILVLRKKVLWANWEDMATNIKQKLRGKGFQGDVEVRFDAQEDMKVYRNNRWQNFVRTPITHMLSVLSGFGMVVWLPYLYWRSEVVVVESNFQIQLDIQRYWEMLCEGLERTDRGRQKGLREAWTLTYPCCNAAYHTVFFELFDRNEDGFLSESDFLGGMLAVSLHCSVLSHGDFLMTELFPVQV
ncbi:unnamed protein product [Effrenium voratum]|uniref:EF-hand domain-containing protein n=1 Tax=Effrenium voratum TaxID=2562239 RepID=A0AA36N5M0_9DINO|nr:unnamed protein product [Effrenium voratum]